MTTSGTYNFSMTVGDIVLLAFTRLQIPRPSITADMMQTAQMELNLLFTEWANAGPNLWTVDMLSTALIAGQAAYTVDPATVMILDARITTTYSNGQPSTDRVITSVSRSEYLSYPSKTTQAPPTVFWFDRLIAPTITLWPVPDASATYVLNMARFRYSQDAYMANGQNAELPNRILDASIWGLAERLSYSYAPQQTQMMQSRYAMSSTLAATQDTENADLQISLDMSRYYR